MPKARTITAEATQPFHHGGSSGTNAAPRPPGARVARDSASGHRPPVALLEVRLVTTLWLAAPAAAEPDAAAEPSAAAAEPEPTAEPGAHTAEPSTPVTAPSEPAIEIAAPSPASEPTPVPAPPKPGKPELSPGAQVFLRSEGRINPDFDASDGTPPDVVQVLERVRLQLGAKWGPVAALVQAQDARSWGFEASTTTNQANIDLHQGWLEVGGSSDARKLSGSLRVGRQEINWGSQRLIGALSWAPPARAFDAIALHGAIDRWTADAFVALMAPPSTFEVPVPTRPDLPPETVQTRGDQLVGGMLGFAAHEAMSVEAVALADFADASVSAPTRERRILDFGARVWGNPHGGLHYEAEGHGQAGRDGAVDHRAWAWVASASYVHDAGRVKPGGKLGYAMASGSRCSGPRAPGTSDGCAAGIDRDFFNFYPTNHIYYGLVDLLGWRNMRDLELGTSLALEWLSASVTYHYLQLQQPRGRWRDAGGALVGRGWEVTNPDHELGHELDVVASLTPWKPLMVQPGYGVFLPTGAGRTLAGSSAQHLVYLWIVATF